MKPTPPVPSPFTEGIAAAFGWTGALAAVYLFFSPGLPRIGMHSPMAWWPVPAVLLAAGALLSLGKMRRGSSGAAFFPVRRQGISALLILAFQIPFHLPYLLHPLARLVADGSVTRLMIRHIVGSGSRPIHFFGQFYQGSLNAYIYSLFHLAGLSPARAMALGNMILYGLAVAVAVRLVQRLQKGPVWPVVILLSLPGAALLSFAQDRIRGMPLVLLLMFYLVDLSVRALRGNDLPAFRFGLAAGALFWCYQPAAVLLIPLGVLLAAGRWLKIGRPFRLHPLAMAAGTLLGAFPHLLAEVNNHFINLHAAASSLLAGTGSFFRLTAKAFHWAFMLLPGSQFLPGFLAPVIVFAAAAAVLVRSLQRRNGLGLILFILPALGLTWLALSGFPPEPRYAVHYQLYGFFFLLGIAQSLAAFPWKRYRLPAYLLIFSAAGWLGEQALNLEGRMKLDQQRVRREIRVLKAESSRVILGGYWQILRVAPLLPDHILAPAIHSDAPERSFVFAKYYLTVLHQGAAWADHTPSLLIPGAKARGVRNRLRDFNIRFREVPHAARGCHLFTRLKPRPSMRFLDAMIPPAQHRRPEHQSRLRITALEAAARSVPSPRASEKGITISGERLPQGATGAWGWVIESEDCRLRLPLQPVPGEKTFSLPPGLALPRGTYRSVLYYLDMPVRKGETLRIPPHSPLTRGTIRLSRLSDRLSVPLFQHRPRTACTGTACHGLTITSLEPATTAIDLEVISIFDFSSTIWTRRLRQALIINGTVYPVDHGRNTIRVPMDGRKLELRTRYVAPLLTRDSRRAPVFTLGGVILVRITPIHSGRPGQPVTPGLEP